MVNCNKASGGVGTRHEDVDEFKGPERLMVDPFGIDGRPGEDTQPPPLPVVLGQLWKVWEPPSISLI